MTNTGNTTRELTVINSDGTPVMDLDPIDVTNNGDVASASDTDLQNVLDSVDDYYDEFGIEGLTLVWSDNQNPVMVECPSCECIKIAISFAVDDDDDCLVCTDCLNG